MLWRRRPFGGPDGRGLSLARKLACEGSEGVVSPESADACLQGLFTQRIAGIEIVSSGGEH